MKGKHGLSGTPEFSVWTDIQSRCHNPNSEPYPRYGGRGISVCLRWRISFTDFLADMGVRPSADHSIERVENDGDYEPANCRWATDIEQANNKRNNVRVCIDGVTKTLPQWCREFGAPYGSVLLRYHQGLTGMDLFRTTCMQLTHAGITDTFSGWGRRTGLKANVIYMRVKKYGWSVADALTKGATL